MNLDEALEQMTLGYALWIGAGVTTHLARAGSVSVPSWEGLVERLEADAGLGRPPPGAHFPDRLERCLQSLKRARFQSVLREQILQPTARGVLQATDDALAAGGVLPQVAWDLAQLGRLANPIVSFNIEAMSSGLIGRPSGPVMVAPFTPFSREPRSMVTMSKIFLRHLYHPHGVLNLSGVCVLARSEYEALDGTLAMQLAVHAAFGTRLAIVGMSLEDQYLREQLGAFRRQVREIIWFVDAPPTESARTWAWKYDVTLVSVGSWDLFWSGVRTILPAPTRGEIFDAWQVAVMEAMEHDSPDESGFVRAAAHLRSTEASAELRAYWDTRIIEHGLGSVSPKPLVSGPVPVADMTPGWRTLVALIAQKDALLR